MCYYCYLDRIWNRPHTNCGHTGCGFLEAISNAEKDCGLVAVPGMTSQVPAPLDEDWAPAVAGWDRLMPRWWPWTQRQIAWGSAGNMDWGHVKCKRVDAAKMMAGVSQVVFWCGVAQQGWRAKETGKEKNKGGERKGLDKSTDA